uniref:EGF-like domain-containing protein n=1 Tax=Chromera velia CCMP2878 TaxID=1169474 RepID=A0A0G4HQL1_9ALVE|eukprot:Cvel_7958.t1-p1 / transcript=Cvel_7958.t1 / gene=Cvel_7958 / organism=Chromera_velia_CCMP2878 / gene_product=Fibrillin-2, putative / transcript_product=Fibrillin-2, putative / location=Cvel_scaffold428:19456-48545(+) / protein_length=3814 / sequence_SO=supercontig / SO=protein_coding / is_pseudo=false
MNLSLPFIAPPPPLPPPEPPAPPEPPPPASLLSPTSPSCQKVCLLEQLESFFGSRWAIVGAFSAPLRLLFLFLWLACFNQLFYATALFNCALGNHNCDVNADCSAVLLSFTCACNSGFEGDGIVCGIRIPPADIGRGDWSGFTWEKDDENTFNGVLTVRKDYTGSVCPGEYRAYAQHEWKWYNFSRTVANTEMLVSSAFDGIHSHIPWQSEFGSAGLNGPDTEDFIILQTPCYINFAGYAWQSRTGNFEDQNPSSVVVAGANSTSGPWTDLHSFSGVNDWTPELTKRWPADVRPDTPFRFFRFLLRRAQDTNGRQISCGQTFLYASTWTELDECATGKHNCDPRASCTDTDGSFTCACNMGWEGNGVGCGYRIPPSDIGGGSNVDFTWTKDGRNLFNEFVTIYKEYTGSVCPGTYRVYPSTTWVNNPGNSSVDADENLPSSLFDGSATGRPWWAADNVESRLSTSAPDSELHITLRTPCYISLAAYSWQSMSCAFFLNCEGLHPSALNVSGSNSTEGPWTTLHSFTGITSWSGGGETKTWGVDRDMRVQGPFNFFRFTVRRVQAEVPSRPLGEQAILYAAAWTELDECAAGLDNCHSHASCGNTNGSFSCTCNAGWDGDGVVCGIRVPPVDIGRGDADAFSWDKDATNLYNGTVTIFKDYEGSVCKGEYRVFAPNGWFNDPGDETVVSNEGLPSVLFDGNVASQFPWHSQGWLPDISSGYEGGEHVILGTPCLVTLAGYAIQSRTDCCEAQAPSAVNVSGSNSSTGPWTILGSFTGEGGWTVSEMRTWGVDLIAGPFRFFRFTMRRVQSTSWDMVSANEIILYAESVTDRDECAEGVHNCLSQASCTNTDGSFTCACGNPLAGDGIGVCGIQIPPPDIGRGDSGSFTWTKDLVDLYNGTETFYKNYTGSVCPGEFRVFSPDRWEDYPGFTPTMTNQEWLPSSLFDGSGVHKAFCTGVDVPTPTDPVESQVHVILSLPCFIVLGGYGWQTRKGGQYDRAPSAMNVSGANSTDGPWTTLHSFTGLRVTDWKSEEMKIWAVDTVAGPFRFIRFTIRRGASDPSNMLDECAAGVHNCDPQATCANTHGSFTCSCPSHAMDAYGDGSLCGIRIPPDDIGRGDPGEFTWTKDVVNLFSGFPTFHTDYRGEICPGEFRVYASNEWDEYSGLGGPNVTLQENPPSALFDGSPTGNPWLTEEEFAGLEAATPSEVHVLLQTPCHMKVRGYAWQAHSTQETRNPSAMLLSGSNSTSGPWTVLHWFQGVTDWTVNEIKTFGTNANGTADWYKVFAFTLWRASQNDPKAFGGDQAYFLASEWKEVNECTAGVHNCDPQATCANTNGSFTCACPSDMEGDGVGCGIRIPPSDIGRGDNQGFTWMKDTQNLFEGLVTIYKEYSGAVCPGQYRVYAPNWVENPGLDPGVASGERLPSALFDSNSLGKQWRPVDQVAGQSNANESALHVILGTPCYIKLVGWALQANDCCPDRNPASMAIAGGNSTAGPWTTLHSFAGVINWVNDKIRDTQVDQRGLGPFRFFRFTYRRMQNGLEIRPQTANIWLYAESWTGASSRFSSSQKDLLNPLAHTLIAELDECLTGVHNCNPEEVCTNTNGSFTCHLRIPQADIGRGDSTANTWTKDVSFLFNGTVTMFKSYEGAVCPGEYRVFAPNGWQDNQGVTTAVDATEALPSSIFDGSESARAYCSPEPSIAGLASAEESAESIILGIPCFLTLEGYALQARNDEKELMAPSALNVSGANSTDGPWTQLHSFSGVNWTLGELKTFQMPHSELAGPFRYFQFTTRRISRDLDWTVCIDQAYLLTSSVTELDECAAGVHNCHPEANCTNTNGSFTCACRTGLEGDGVNVCGLLIPPADIGRGDNDDFSWTKDDFNRYNGIVTIYKEYAGEVCPGEYRVYASNSWFNDPGDATLGFEGLPSSLFDRDTQGLPWRTVDTIAGYSSTTESEDHLILGTPCYISLEAFAWQARADCCTNENPSAMNVSGAYNIEGPWTLLHSFSGVTDWSVGELKTFTVDPAVVVSAGKFRFFKMNVRKVNRALPGIGSGAQAFFSAADWTELDECAAGVHNCHLEANCTNTNGSFTCACNTSTGLSGDGIVCGIQIPPVDIGTGTMGSAPFTWAKDDVNLFTGIVTIYKHYAGAVCPGEYRVYTSHNWYGYAGVTTAVGPSTEFFPSSLFDGTGDGRAYCSAATTVAGLNDPAESELQIILGTPCYVHMAGYAWETRAGAEHALKAPSAMNFSASNSTEGPWTTLDSFTGVTNWEKAETKTWAVGVVAGGPFRFFRYTLRRTAMTTASDACGERAPLYALSWTELDECLAGVHNCNSEATCTNTNGSFTCTCPPGLVGDGVVACGFRIPSLDIGRGDAQSFTWTKDDTNLYEGTVTIYKEYSGEVCPGEYRVYAPNEWFHYPGVTSTMNSNEWAPSSLFDGSTVGLAYCTDDGSANFIASPTDPVESEVHVILGLPCFVSLNAYAWETRAEAAWYGNVPSAMNVSAANSTDGPWTWLHSFENVTEWSIGELKEWGVDAPARAAGPFNFIRFTIRRGAMSPASFACGAQAFIYASAWKDLDECAAGVHNCAFNAYCTNTNGSFTCACLNGVNGDGIVCGTEIPPSDIGRGDSDSFTWTKDDVNLYNGVVTIYKEYTGAVCPGEYRVMTPEDWANNPGVVTHFLATEWLPSSLFDGNTDFKGWCSTDGAAAGQTDVAESQVHIILHTPCYITLSGYSFDIRSGDFTSAPTAMNVSGSNSSSGPWTTLHSFEGVSWNSFLPRKWQVKDLQGPFSFFRFTVRRVQNPTADFACGDLALLYAASWTEVDECAEGTHSCHSEANCTNTNGSFVCSCFLGLEGNGTFCADADECTLATDDCSSVASCLNTYGSFQCSCPQGYNGTGVVCTEIDECEDSTHDCHLGAFCANTNGSFECHCNTGFNDTGVGVGLPQGTECTNVDECQIASDDCASSASCNDTFGSFTCTCGNGLFGPGTFCADVDECSSNTHNCDIQAACTNTAGSFFCSCQTGFGGNGVFCIASLQVACGASRPFQRGVVQGVPPDVCLFQTSSMATVLKLNMPQPHLIGAQVLPNKTFEASTCNAAAMQDTAISVSNLANDTCRGTVSDDGAAVCPSNPQASTIQLEGLPGEFYNIRAAGTGGTVQVDVSVSCACPDNYTLGMGDICAVLCQNQPLIATPGWIEFTNPSLVATTGAEVSWCNDGYLETGSPTVTCSGVEGADPPQAVWQEDSRVSGCAAVACSGEIPTAPTYGSMTPSSPPDGDSWKTGDTVTFSCPPPLVLYGDSSKTCTAVPLKKEARWNDYSVRTLCRDVTPPSFYCPDYTLETDPQSSQAQVPSYSLVSITDPGGISSVVRYPDVPRPFPAGITQVTITATDTEGNAGSCTFKVIVEDNEAPTVLCPPDINRKQLLLDPLPVEYPKTPVVFDNVDKPEKVQLSFSHPSGTAFPPGQTTVTVFASDSSKNVGTCKFLVTVEACPYGSERVAQTAPCICRAGFWQDLRGISFDERKRVDRTKTYPVCQDCLQNSNSPRDSTHPSACACKEGFYFAPAENAEERPTALGDYTYWTAGKCLPCPPFTSCLGTLFGSDKELQSDGLLLQTQTGTSEREGARRLGESTEQQHIGVQEKIFEAGQHPRPKPESGYVLARSFPTAIVVECPIGQTCEETVFTETDRGWAEVNVTCAEGMRGVMVLFYTAMNSVPSEEDEKTHVVAIRTLLNFLSLIGFIGMINFEVPLPEGIPSLDELIPGIPSINGVLSTDCILEPLLLAAGYPPDEAFIILKIGNTLKMVASGLFLTLLGASIVFGASSIKSE